MRIQDYTTADHTSPHQLAVGRALLHIDHMLRSQLACRKCHTMALEILREGSVIQDWTPVCAAPGCLTPWLTHARNRDGSPAWKTIAGYQRTCSRCFQRLYECLGTTALQQRKDIRCMQSTCQAPNRQPDYVHVPKDQWGKVEGLWACNDCRKRYRQVHAVPQQKVKTTVRIAQVDPNRVKHLQERLWARQQLEEQVMKAGDQQDVEPAGKRPRQHAGHGSVSKTIEIALVAPSAQRAAGGGATLEEPDCTSEGIRPQGQADNLQQGGCSTLGGAQGAPKDGLLIRTLNIDSYNQFSSVLLADEDTDIWLLQETMLTPELYRAHAKLADSAGWTLVQDHVPMHCDLQAQRGTAVLLRKGMNFCRLQGTQEWKDLVLQGRLQGIQLYDPKGRLQLNLISVYASTTGGHGISNEGTLSTRKSSWMQ